MVEHRMTAYEQGYSDASAGLPSSPGQYKEWADRQAYKRGYKARCEDK